MLLKCNKCDKVICGRNLVNHVTVINTTQHPIYLRNIPVLPLHLFTIWEPRQPVWDQLNSSLLDPYTNIQSSWLCQNTGQPQVQVFHSN